MDFVHQNININSVLLGIYPFDLSSQMHQVDFELTKSRGSYSKI